MRSKEAIHWHILGAGSLGCLWAAYFAKNGLPCTLLLKNQQRLEDYQQQNTVHLQKGKNSEQFTINATSIEQLHQPISYLIVTTKAHQTFSAVKSIAPLLKKDSTILLIQNGMGTQQQLADAYPNSEILVGVSTDGANCAKPFHVIHAGIGKTHIGRLKSKLPEEQYYTLIRSLPHDSLDLEYAPDIERRLWQKLAINSAINALTAIYHCKNGELLTITEAHMQLLELCDEISEILNKLGHAAAIHNLPEQAIAVAGATASNRSSMLQDIENRRKTEIEAINGYLCQRAEKANIPAPLNKRIVMQILALEQRLDCR